nr:DUF3237 family protein [Streptomyces wedmorensis]
MRCSPGALPNRPKAGQKRYRTSPVFRTDVPAHRWLAETVLVGHTRPEGEDVVVIRVYRLRCTTAPRGRPSAGSLRLFCRSAWSTARRKRNPVVNGTTAADVLRAADAGPGGLSSVAGERSVRSRAAGQAR